MKNNKRRIDALFKIISIERFYAINIYKTDCRIQGNYQQSLIGELIRNKFIMNIDDDYVRFMRGNITITLT